MTREDIAKLPYRPCVGVMLINGAGQVFVAQRGDRYTDAWQMPQGGVDEGEGFRDAALRELEEETSVPRDAVTVVAETAGMVRYDLPHDLVPNIWKGRYRGQEQKWFLLRLDGPDSLIDLNTAHPEFTAWRWVPLDQVVPHIVAFKRGVYEQVVAEFAKYF